MSNKKINQQIIKLLKNWGLNKTENILSIDISASIDNETTIRIEYRITDKDIVEDCNLL